jgi:site-specific recombinase XerD
MTLEDATERYLFDLETQGKLCLRRHSKCWLTRFREFCHPREVREVAALDIALLGDFRQHVLWTPGPKGALYSQNSLFQAQRMVRAFLSWLHAHDLILEDLTAGWILRRPPQTARNVPTVEGISRLLLAPSANHRTGLRARAVVELLYGTGVRLAECHALDLDSLDLESSRLHVRGKGGKERALPIGGHLRQSLRRYLEVRDLFKPAVDQRALLLNTNGGRLCKQSIRQTIWNACETAGLPRFGPHTLRHAFAIHLMEAGAELPYIQALLGHENLDTTAIYTQVRPLELLSEYRRTHPRASRSEPDGEPEQ